MASSAARTPGDCARGLPPSQLKSVIIACCEKYAGGTTSTLIPRGFSCVVLINESQCVAGSGACACTCAAHITTANVHPIHRYVILVNPLLSFLVGKTALAVPAKNFHTNCLGPLHSNEQRSAVARLTPT